MTVVAGVDIGNSSTEIVLVRADRAGVEVVASARSMTRGAKGSPESLLAAARLVRRAAAAHSVTVASAAVAPLRPVRTLVRTAERPAPDTTPLRQLTPTAVTAAGDASAAGRPVPVANLDTLHDGPVVAIVDAATSYRQAATAINGALRAGVRVVAVLVERDEAVLIANRLDVPLPVVDQVPTLDVMAAQLIAVEARPSGRPLRHVIDPYWVARTFDLPVSRVNGPPLVHGFADASYAVIARLPDAAPPARATPPETDVERVRWRDGSVSVLTESVDRLRTARPGAVAAVALGPGWVDADDVFAVDLFQIAHQAHVRRGTVDSSHTLVALLHSAEGGVADAVAVLTDALGAPVTLASSESEVGRAGALTTPGCPPDALVVDLGGGTVDVSDCARHHILAGAGELLTRATARALMIPAGTAEYAKRTPALFADGPHILVDEKGARSFTESALPHDGVGSLCVPGPVGLIAFNRTLSIGEWRAWRGVAKAEIIGRNVERGVAALEHRRPAPLVVVGGAAADDEIIAAIARRVPPGSVVGRGDVAGSLGHRYAVAYGLARLGVERL